MPIEGIDGQFRLFPSKAHLYPQTEQERMREQYADHAPPPLLGKTILEPCGHRGGCSLYAKKQDILDARRAAWRKFNTQTNFRDHAINFLSWVGRLLSWTSAVEGPAQPAPAVKEGKIGGFIKAEEPMPAPAVASPLQTRRIAGFQSGGAGAPMGSLALMQPAPALMPAIQAPQQVVQGGMAVYAPCAAPTMTINLLAMR